MGMYNSLRDKNFLLLLFSDSTFVVGSFILSIYLRFDFFIPAEVTQLLIPKYFLGLLLIKILCFRFYGLYRGMWRYTSVWDMLNIIKANVTSTLIVFLIIHFYLGFSNFSKSVFLIDLTVCLGAICVSRLGIRIFFSKISKGSSKKESDTITKNIIIIGAGDTGQTILRQLFQRPNNYINVIGFLDDNPKKIGRRIHGVTVLDKISNLSKLTVPIDEIYICVPSATRTQMRLIIEECKQFKVPFKTLPSFSELIQGKVSISQLREVSLSDLLGRDEIILDKSSINKFIKGKRVLVTGAGGSIGSELVRQCIKFEPSVLLMLDISELNLFEIDREVKNTDSQILFKPILSDVRDYSVINQVFEEFHPQVVFHAAAYKHVPMQEYFPWEAVKTNIFGTHNIAEIAIKNNVEKFVLVSTDKAVKPVNVMGATKRLAEMITHNYNRLNNHTEFMAVRFGNVLGSSGSVIPIFQEQIKKGGPVTVTDPDMERYFMSIPEASQLILQAGSIGVGGEVFILDMGEPIKIIDIASELIRLSGYEPNTDIPIEFTGTRPGEKKIEELSLPTEKLDKTKHDKIFVLNNQDLNHEKLSKIILGVEKLKNELSGTSANQVRSLLSSILPEYQPNLDSKEPVYLRVKSDLEAKA